MSPSEIIPKDLVVLTADSNMKAAVEGLLSQHQALSIRQISFQVFAHVHRDPGCLRESHQFLRSLIRQYQYALVMFDREGCGRENLSREDLESQVENHLSRNGWPENAIAIVLDPELEVWVWGGACRVETVFGWNGKQVSMKEWLTEKGFFRDGDAFPQRPKEAMEAALKFIKKPRSSAIYLELAKTASLNRCTDPAFRKFHVFLQDCFPRETPNHKLLHAQNYNSPNLENVREETTNYE